jgi:hypothetical protein
MKTIPTDRAEGGCKAAGAAASKMVTHTGLQRAPARAGRKGGARDERPSACYAPEKTQRGVRWLICA